MKLETLQIKNLRSCKDVTISLNPYTCLIGPNGAGKSTILTALNIFFRENQQPNVDVTNLVHEDFHQKKTDDPISITLTFTDLNTAAQEDFRDYYRNGKLIITAEARYDPDTQRATVRQYGRRFVMQEFARFFEADGNGAKVAELKTIYEEIRKSIVPDLPAPSTKDSMKEALREYETAHPERCVILPSEDQFYGISKGKNRLEKYIQWVYVPAVKDVATEQLEQRNTAFGKLLGRTVRARANFAEQLEGILKNAQEAYQALLRENQQVLTDVSNALQKRLEVWAHPDATLHVEWWQDPEKAVSVLEPVAYIVVGEDMFKGQLCRLGHGLQRSFLLALLQELASTSDQTAPRLLLGCEEPELYQHPPQARHLFNVFQTLAGDNAQVIVSTHSPYFVSGETFEDVRLIKKDPATKQTTAKFVTYDQVAAAVTRATGGKPYKPEGIRAKMQQALQVNLNEMFFAQRLVLVEGLEDAAYITAYLHLTDRWDEYRRQGVHIIPVGGKHRLIQPLAIARAMSIPTIVVFDSDGHRYGKVDPTSDPEGKRGGERALHKLDNTVILQLAGAPVEDPFPATPLFHENVVMWHSEIGKVVQEDIGSESWRLYKQQVEQELGQAGDLEKNGILIAHVLAKAWEDGKTSENLERLCAKILPETKRTTPQTMTAGS